MGIKSTELIMHQKVLCQSLAVLKVYAEGLFIS